MLLTSYCTDKHLSSSQNKQEKNNGTLETGQIFFQQICFNIFVAWPACNSFGHSKDSFEEFASPPPCRQDSYCSQLRSEIKEMKQIYNSDPNMARTGSPFVWNASIQRKFFFCTWMSSNCLPGMELAGDACHFQLKPQGGLKCKVTMHGSWVGGGWQGLETQGVDSSGGQQQVECLRFAKKTTGNRENWTEELDFRVNCQKNSLSTQYFWRTKAMFRFQIFRFLSMQWYRKKFESAGNAANQEQAAAFAFRSSG